MVNFAKQLCCLTINERRNLIISYLKERNIYHNLQKFESPFGFGYNIIVGATKSNNDLIITAHYDGHGIFDNAGGVIALLRLIEMERTENSKHSIQYVFTDMEERFQQGAFYFLKEYYSQSTSNIILHWNIDGFGIGDTLVIRPNEYSLSNLIGLSNSPYILLTEGDIFENRKINAFHLFSCKHDDSKILRSENNSKRNFRKYLNESWCLKNYFPHDLLYHKLFQIIYKANELVNPRLDNCLYF